MNYQKKTKGLRLLRMVGSQALGRGKHASFSPEELKGILEELDKYYPVANKQAKRSRDLRVP
jgi:hypothetical protein